jgi:ATPase subunit of ABC transporter with duplicated ATPase domains
MPNADELSPDADQPGDRSDTARKTTGNPAKPRVGIVGPCAAGKSTLVKSLTDQKLEVEMRHIAQEHSYVQSMWQKISKPRWLIFLDVSYPVTMQRKKLNWSLADYEEQQRRLAHARQHADLYLMTDDFTPEQVAEKVIEFLNQV